MREIVILHCGSNLSVQLVSRLRVYRWVRKPRRRTARCKHGKHVGLDQRVQQGEQHSHESPAARMLSMMVYVHQLRDQQTAEHSAEQAEAHGDGQGELLQRAAHAPEAVADTIPPDRMTR